MVSIHLESLCRNCLFNVLPDHILFHVLKKELHFIQARLFLAMSLRVSEMALIFH